MNTNLKEIKLDWQDIFVTGNGIYAMRTDRRRLQVSDDSKSFNHKHGRITTKVYASKRIITLEWYIDRSDNANHQTAFEYLQSMFVLQSDTGELTPRTLYIKDIFDNERSLPVKVTEPLDILPYNENMYDIAWKRRVVLESTDDPTYYSTTENSVAGFESEYGWHAVTHAVPLSMTNYSYYITLTNSGNVETSMRIEITAINNFTSPIKIKDTTNNKLLQFNTSATAGDTIIIDTGAKTATKNWSSILWDREPGSVWITFKGTIKLVIYDLDGAIPENDLSINIYFSNALL